MPKAAETTTTPKMEKERSEFRQLLLQNANYFGHLEKSTLKAVKKIVANTSYEQLNCVGYNPDKQFLEATISIKQPFGYGGDLCHTGTTEYVRFFIDYGSGWVDAGLAGAVVHDIPTGHDCAKQLTKPLTYVASLKLSPHIMRCCNHPVLPKVHAILSWNLVPPAGAANAGWLPPWGNTLDCHVQIKPRPWSLFCILEEVSVSLNQKLKVPPLFEQVQYNPIPIPDPPPLSVSELALMYTGKEAKAQKIEVEGHRFGTSDLHTALTSGAFSEALVVEKAETWKAAGLDLSAVIGALQETNGNTTYEQLECLGIDDSAPERLVATFRIKRPYGYSGNLCQAGSKEYVAFWADWDNTCKWSYMGTVAVNVHDIASIPKEGLCYSAILPVDLTYHRRPCGEPKIARVRAVLSWAVPPSTTNPDALDYWGNRLDTHVQINPGDVITGLPPAKIRNLGGIPVEDIDTVSNGMTLSAAVFGHYPGYSADAWGLNRACPFGGQVVIEGNYYLPYYYRVKVHKATDPPSSYTVLGDSFLVERWDTGFDLQTSSGGFFKFLDPATHFDRTLALWNTSGDDLWEVQLDLSTAPTAASIFVSSPWYRLQLDNTAPQGPPASPLTMDIHITSGGGDCKDIAQGDTIIGDFIADDLHFGGWSLSTEPNTLTTPSNQPTVTGLVSTSPAPAPAGHSWSLNTATPISMKPCGYVVRLDVVDRTIVNSVPGQHNGNHIEVGFCLREK
jgi:hypothetical protein